MAVALGASGAFATCRFENKGSDDKVTTLAIEESVRTAYKDPPCEAVLTCPPPGNAGRVLQSVNCPAIQAL